MRGVLQYYRYISCDSFSQFDSLPLTSVHFARYGVGAAASVDTDTDGVTVSDAAKDVKKKKIKKKKKKRTSARPSVAQPVSTVAGVDRIAKMSNAVPTADNEVQALFRARLASFYQRHNPAKLESDGAEGIAQIVSVFAREGKLEELQAKLEAKYGAKFLLPGDERAERETPAAAPAPAQAAAEAVGANADDVVNVATEAQVSLFFSPFHFVRILLTI